MAVSDIALFEMIIRECAIMWLGQIGTKHVCMFSCKVDSHLLVNVLSLGLAKKSFLSTAVHATWSSITCKRIYTFW